MRKITYNVTWIAVLFGLLGALSGWGALSIWGTLGASQPRTARETALARLQRTGVLRCGFIVAPPFVVFDPNAGRPTGFDIDYARAMALMLGLSLTWRETQYGAQVEDLRMGKMDAICAGEAPLVAQASLYLAYAAPKAWFPIYMFVREKETRFDGAPAIVRARANQPDVTAASMDGDVSQDFAARLFPKAQRHALPRTADLAQLYMDVAQGRADFVMEDPFTAAAFMKNNPGQIRAVRAAGAFAVIPTQMSVLRGEESLADLLSQGVMLMRQRGVEKEILDRYAALYPNSFFPAAMDYAAAP